MNSEALELYAEIVGLEEINGLDESIYHGFWLHDFAHASKFGGTKLYDLLNELVEIKILARVGDAHYNFKIIDN